MRKKMLKALVGLAAVALLAVVPALGQAVSIQSNLDEVPRTQFNDEAEFPHTTYFEDNGSLHGPATCNPNCPSGEPCYDEPWCEPTFRGPKRDGPAFRGPADNHRNYTPGELGNVWYAVWAAEKNAGTADHFGYYAFVCDPITEAGAESDWREPDCVGNIEPIDCIGNGNPNTATGTDFTALGSIDPLGGLSVMPVPYQIDDGDPGDNLITLQWDAVEAEGDCTASAQYDLYYYRDDIGDNTCDQPTTDQLTFLRTVDGVETTIDIENDLGADSFSPGDPYGLVFAIKLRYPQANDPDRGEEGTGELVHRYFSANSLCTSFDAGLSASISDLEATYQGGRTVIVSWSAKETQTVEGYYVQRAVNPAGPFERVSDMIPANGGPYAHADQLQQLRVPAGRASGLYYRVEVIDSDKGSFTSGVAAVDRPDERRQRRDIDREIRRAPRTESRF